MKKMFKEKKNLMIAAVIIIVVLAIGGIVYFKNRNLARPAKTKPADLRVTEGNADLITPTPPVGFTWKSCEKTGSSFLLPDAWFFKEVKDGDTSACFISKESIEQNGIYKTGFSVNILRDIASKRGIPPSKIAENMMEDFAKTHKVGPIVRGGKKTDYFTVLARTVYVEPKKADELIETFRILIANDKTGTLYLMIFESPESEFKEAWKIGDIITRTYLLDEKY